MIRNRANPTIYRTNILLSKIKLNLRYFSVARETISAEDTMTKSNAIAELETKIERDRKEYDYALKTGNMGNARYYEGRINGLQVALEIVRFVDNKLVSPVK